MHIILHAFAKSYQGYKSIVGFHVPFDREIISDQKSFFGIAERNTPSSVVIDGGFCAVVEVVE